MVLTDMKSQNKHIKSYLEFLLASISFAFIYLLVLTIFRVAFYIGYAPKNINNDYFSDILSAFFLGFRFDLQIVSYLLIIPVLGCIIFFLALKKDTDAENREVTSRVPRRIFSIYYTITTVVLIFISWVDYYYYAYFQDHIDFMIFGFLDDDTTALIITFWKNYPLVKIAVGFIFIVFLLYKASNFILKQAWLKNLASIISDKVSSRITWSLVPLFLIFLMARGTFSIFPLSLSDTTISQNQFVNKIPINSVLAFHGAYKIYVGQRKYSDRKSYADQHRFKKDIHEAIKIWWGKRQVPEGKTVLDKITRRTPHQNTGKPHVIVVIMESFGSYWLQYQSSDFNVMGELENHLKTDYYFQNFTSSTGNTIGSTTTLISNLPRSPDTNFLSEGKYSKLAFKFAAPQPYKKAGYETHFVYAGAAGWRNMNNFYIRQGFDSIESKSTILAKLNKPKKSQLGNEWGVYDEYMFEYLYEILDQATTPQFIVVLTTTNHPPYDLPKTYEPFSLKIPQALEYKLIGNEKLLKQRFVVYQYSNHHAGKFLSKIKNSTLKDKTVIAITGDHGFRAVNFNADQSLQKIMVPLYIYTPKKLAPEYYSPDTFGSHTDILPTLYNLTLSDATYQSLGVDLFSRTGNHYSIYMNHIYSSEGAVTIGRNKKQKYFYWDSESAQKYQSLQPVQKPSPGLKKLENIFHATMMISEFILEKELSNNSETSTEK